MVKLIQSRYRGREIFLLISLFITYLILLIRFTNGKQQNQEFLMKTKNIPFLTKVELFRSKLLMMSQRVRMEPYLFRCTL